MVVLLRAEKTDPDAPLSRLEMDENLSTLRAIKSGVFNVKDPDYGAVGDGSTNDTDAFVAAIAACEAAGGGQIYVPNGTYNIASTLTFDFSNFSLVGESKTGTVLDFDDATSGNGIDVGRCYDWEIVNINVVNAFADAFTIGVKNVGPQSYAAWFSLRNCASNNSGGRGIAFGKAYMFTMDGLRMQNATTYGFEFGATLEETGVGFSTTVAARACHAVDCDSDGWKIRSVMYSTFAACGADRSGGYGYNLQDIHTTKFIGSGAEDSQQSALYFEYDSTSTSLAKGFKGLSFDGFFEKDNNAAAGSNGTFAHFHATAGTSNPGGTIEFRNCSEYDAPASYSMRFESGNYRVHMPRSLNNITRNINGSSFAVIGDGATDALNGIAVNVSGANTPICKLRPKLTNGVTSYGGLVTVHAAQNNMNSSSRSACYVIAISRSVGTSDISVVASQGNDAGADAADASFTWNLDTTNDHLEVTVAGSTATGNYYFYISAIGNLDIEPL